MKAVIYSRKLNRSLTYHMNGDKGYIYADLNGEPGTLGLQICKGGQLSGATINANHRDFHRKVRAWHRAYIAQLED